MSGEGSKSVDAKSKKKDDKSSDDETNTEDANTKLTQGTTGSQEALVKNASVDAILALGKRSSMDGVERKKSSGVERSRKSSSGAEPRSRKSVTEPRVDKAEPKPVQAPKPNEKSIKKPKKNLNAAELQARMGKKPQVDAPKPVVMDTKNMNIFQKMLAERNQAKQEESDYLKIRKEQLLRDLLPKSKGARLRRSDEKFPSATLRSMEKWNFGAMKAKYMAIRPNGKYANWFGKKHDEKHKHEKCIPIKERILMSRQKGPQQTAQKGKNESTKTMKGSKNAKEAPPPSLPPPADLPPAEENSQARCDDEDQQEEEDFMTNVRYSRPFNDKGVLFWMDEQDNNVDTEDEETIVNLDSVVKDGEVAQTMVHRFVSVRNSVPVDMTNPISEMMKIDKIYTNKDVYLSTIVNVINLTPAEKEKEKALLHKKEPTPRKIVWKTEMMVAEYDGGAESVTAGTGQKTEKKPLKDVVKVAEKE